MSPHFRPSNVSLPGICGTGICGTDCSAPEANARIGRNARTHFPSASRRLSKTFTDGMISLDVPKLHARVYRSAVVGDPITHKRKFTRRRQKLLLL
jgi:hypothetical protein